VRPGRSAGKLTGTPRERWGAKEEGRRKVHPSISLGRGLPSGNGERAGARRRGHATSAEGSSSSRAIQGLDAGSFNVKVIPIPLRDWIGILVGTRASCGGGDVPRKSWNLRRGSRGMDDEWTNYRVRGIMRLPF